MKPKNILLTGGSRGIGFETAVNLCRKGHHVITLARSEVAKELIRKRCAATGGTLNALQFDLSAGDYEVLARRIGEQVQGLDALVNNAGLLVVKPFDRLTEEDFDRIFAVNVKSVFLLTKSMLPLLNKGSHIVNISSMGGVQGSAKFPGLSLYSAAKGAVAVLTEAMAEEFKEKKISVNALAPGAVQTEMLAQAFPDYKAPLTPQEIADFIADFVIKGHHFFNGKVLPLSLTTP